MLKPGTPAPNPNVTTHLGQEGPLSDFWKEGPLILFFYPKDDTSICTKQACTLQTSLSSFGEFGASVLGSSTDNGQRHEHFAKKHGISFPLVIDKGGKLAKAFEARRAIIGISKRITYVIDQEGVIKGALHDEFSVGAHLDMIKSVL